MNNKYNLEDLLYLMQRLREPEFGCPWDIKQDFTSIVPCTLEECYEVVDAIESEDWPHLAEELGDLLFQIIFYSQLATEKKLFDMSDVIHNIVEKLIRRHPHVFPNNQLHEKVLIKLNDEQITESWESLKALERLKKAESKQKFSSILNDIPNALPALLRAEKIQKRAAKVGFDWTIIEPVIAKIEEELAELKEAIDAGDLNAIKDEMGDVLFSQVNLARHLNVCAEEALRGANKKFTQRFNYIEAQVTLSEKNWEQHQLFELDVLWHKAKAQGL